MAEYEQWRTSSLRGLQKRDEKPSYSLKTSRSTASEPSSFFFSVKQHPSTLHGHIATIGCYISFPAYKKQS